MTTIRKKGRKDLKGNYRLNGILAILLEVFGRIMFAHMSNFFDNNLPKQQCGFRKGYCAQHCWQFLLACAFDNCEAFDALLADFSEVFDSLGHEL